RLAALVFLLLFYLPTLISCSKEAPVVKETYVMGTKASITIYGMSRTKALGAAGKALHELHRLETVMSTWDPGSEISKLNLSAGKKPFVLSPELSELIRISTLFSEKTGGAFDITARPIVRLWGFQDGARQLPSDKEISNTLDRVGYGKIKIDENRNSVTLPEGTQIDLAGVAKGYGVDRCVEILKNEGVESALVNLGGNIYAFGSPPGKTGWVVGIRNPTGDSEITGYIILKDEAVATSGNYENFIRRDDETIGHIINPLTGRPVSGNTLSVTVISPTAAASDALSTALFVLGPEKGLNILREIKGTGSEDYISETALRAGKSAGAQYAKAVFIVSDGSRIKFVKSRGLEGKVILE
ncbi:MAG TPA: FAD:protein FMN transferase, partial [Candidatus Krumholzibacteriaceae bacterium]|nr:FAD:protein FMN transferase [Candidatus Krumholzibacteriaceae bacterium]